MATRDRQELSAKRERELLLAAAYASKGGRAYTATQHGPAMLPPPAAVSVFIPAGVQGLFSVVSQVVGGRGGIHEGREPCRRPEGNFFRYS
jgi:hypothetical protein